MIRALLSVVTLLLVVLLVMKLASMPLRTLAPQGSASAAGGVRAPNAAEQTAERVKRAIEQGAAQRAEDAASR